MKTTYKRNISDLKDIEKNGFKVFSCFCCGGGSSMGYKLAGFDVQGVCDIDPQMMKNYVSNFNPKHSYTMSIQNLSCVEGFQNLFSDIDILDGSPPCSTFSMSGDREKVWDKKKKFREGQEEQILSDLFFDYIDVCDMLKPKVVVAENVEGMLRGNAKGYVKMIVEKFDKIGYNVQIFLLNAASMGVPQRRKRVFFIGSRKDLNFPKIKMDFNEKPILFGEFDDGCIKDFKPIIPSRAKYWPICKPGDAFSTVHEKGPNHQFNSIKLSKLQIPPTVASSGGSLFYHPEQPRLLTLNELCCIGSRPRDYNFNNTNPQYVIGMSVPPLMMGKIAENIDKQWLSLLNK